MFRFSRILSLVCSFFILTGLSAKPPVGIDMVPEKNRIAIKAERPITKKGFETAKQNREDQNEEIALNEERLPLVRSSSVGRPSGESIDYTQQESSYVCPAPTQVSQPYQTQAVYEPCCTPKRAWIIPAVAAAGGIGAGVAAATSSDRDDPSPNGPGDDPEPQPIDDLTFDFFVEGFADDGGFADIEFQLQLTDGTVLYGPQFSFMVETFQTGPLPVFFPGDTLIVRALDFGAQNGTLTFTMTMLIGGVPVETQIFEFTDGDPETPPQDFIFVVP